MRIWKKISAGFGVLLVLVLLVGVMALHALNSIEEETTFIMREFPSMNEKMLELRRLLLKGIKDYNSFFLNAKPELSTAGRDSLQEAQRLIVEFIAAPLPPEQEDELRPLFTKLRDVADEYLRVATETIQLSDQLQESVRNTALQGNTASVTALNYLKTQIHFLISRVDPLDTENLQPLLQRLELAEKLTRSVAQTRITAGKIYLNGATMPPAQAQQLLEKDIIIFHKLLELEQDPDAMALLHEGIRILSERLRLSNETSNIFAQIIHHTDSMAHLEEQLYNISRTALQTIHIAFVQQLKVQRELTHNTSGTLRVFLIATLIFGIIFATLLARHLSLAIMRSLDFARAVSSGNLSQRLPMDQNDELGQINHAMNSMLDSLDNKIEEAHQNELGATEARLQAEKAQAAAEEASRAKDDFLARMSHEIRTPMNAIIGLGHLCQQTRLDEQQRQYMTKILASANELLGILNEILDFSKIEGGKLELDRIPFQLNVVLENLARIISQRAKAKGLDFVYHMDRNIPTVLVGDPLRLTQILINLAGNAVKFTDNGAVAITISCVASTPPDITLCFRIKDSGIGMAPEQIQQIFQPFTQADGSNTRRFGGTGIGLSISQRLVALMEGTIAAERNPEGGSTFSFTVPLRVAEGAAPLPLRTVKDIRALIVDDSPLALQVTFANFASLGISADCAESGPEALRALALAEQNGMPYHLIILDWRMPEIDGLETARRIRNMATTADPPVIILHSDYALLEIQPLAQQAGVTSFLPKPATASAFYDAIMDALGRQLDHGPATDETPPATTTGPTRVLLVEDNEINQEIACELLKMAQVDVETVNNGQEAVEAVARQSYGLIFMDVQMPVMDGLEATRRIRAAGHTMPIIAMTAHAMRGDKDISLAAGMNDHLTKPLDPEALFTAINHWMPSSSTPMGASSEASSTPKRSAQRKLPDRISGFNLSAGLAAVGNNEELYADLLNKFATRYATITEDITTSLQHNDLETAVRHAHTVKGIAANLGAESLAEAAGTLEKTITHDPSMTTPHLKTLIQRLADAVNAIRTALGSDGTNTMSMPSIPLDSILTVSGVEELCMQLHEAVVNMEIDWSRAADIVQQTAKTLRGTDLEKQAIELRHAVEDFETQAAQDLLQVLQQALRGAAKA